MGSPGLAMGSLICTASAGFGLIQLPEAPGGWGESRGRTHKASDGAVAGVMRAGLDVRVGLLV